MKQTLFIHRTARALCATFALFCAATAANAQGALKPKTVPPSAPKIATVTPKLKKPGKDKTNVAKRGKATGIAKTQKRGAAPAAKKATPATRTPAKLPPTRNKPGASAPTPRPKLP